MRIINTLVLLLLLLITAANSSAQTAPVYGTSAFPGIQDGNYRSNEPVTVVKVTNNLLGGGSRVYYTKDNTVPTESSLFKISGTANDTIILNVWDTIPGLGEPHPCSVITLWTPGDIPRRYAYWYLPLLTNDSTKIKPTLSAFPGSIGSYSFYDSQIVLLKAVGVTGQTYSIDEGTPKPYNDRDTIWIRSSCKLTLSAPGVDDAIFKYTLLDGVPGSSGMNGALNTPDSIRLNPQSGGLLALAAYPNTYNAYVYYNVPTAFWFSLDTKWQPQNSPLYSLKMNVSLVKPNGQDSVLLSNVYPNRLGFDNNYIDYQYTMPSVLRFMGLTDAISTQDFLSKYKLKIELRGRIPGWWDQDPDTVYTQTMLYPLRYISPINQTNTINLDIYRNEKTGVNLEEMLRTMGFLGGRNYNPATDSVYWWYMDDPYSPAGTVYTQNRFEVKALTSDGTLVSTTKLCPWINSTELGTFTYYARTIQGDIPVIVKVKPPFKPDTINYNLLRVETFGSGTGNIGTPIPNRTNYTWKGTTFPGDDEYSIVKRMTRSGDDFPPDWKTGMQDHTQPGNGYMYIVNAAKEQGGMFYTDTVSACSNMGMRFSAYFSNLCNGTFNSGNYAGYRIHPNVLIRLIDPVRNLLLKEQYTGDIPTYGMQTAWKKYFLNFNTLDADSIVVQFLNVNIGGLGNDFAIDDITIERAISELKIVAPTENCMNGSLTLQVDSASIAAIYHASLSSSPESKLYYKWVKNNNSVEVLDSIAYGLYNSSSFALDLGVPPLNGDIYTFSIASDSAALGDACVTSVSYQMIKPNISLSVNVADGSIVCPCTPVTISASVDGNDSGGDNLIWYAGSLNNEIGRGPGITVNPEETTKYYVTGLCVKDSVTIEVGSSPSLNFGSVFGEDYYYQDPGIYAMRVSIADSSILRLPVNFVRGTGLVGYIITDSIKGDTIVQGGPLKVTSGMLASQYLPIQLTNTVKPSRSDFRGGENIVRLTVALRDQGTNTCPDTIPFRLHIISDSSVWVPQDNSINWNDDANWKITDYQGNRYAEGGVPMANTSVWIPGDATVYPVLKHGQLYDTDEVPADDGFGLYPQALAIHFQMGGEVARLQYLQYLKAFVDLNLGYYDGSGIVNGQNASTYPYMLARDRYYSITAPLKDMYAGDYAFGGKPNVYMKYADPISINAVRGDSEAELIQKWTNSINTYKVPFTAGFGFGYEVYSGDLDEEWPYKNNQKNLNSISGLVEFPYFTNSTYLAAINPLHTFAGDSTGSGTSTFTYYQEGMPESPLSKTDEVERKTDVINNMVTQTVYGSPVSVPLANRFIIEDSLTNTIPDSYPVTIGASQKDSEILIGNPFLSHLRFKSFYLKNAGLIGRYYRIWLGTAQYYTVAVDANGNYEASTVASDSIKPGDDMLIAPMQSFFVPIRSNASGNTITFDIDSMSVTKPNKSVADGVLRSSGTNNAGEILKITAANSRYSATAVVINKPGEKELSEGVPKLFSPNGNIPEVYLIQDYKKEIIEIDGTDQAIPLEIKTKVTGGNLKLTFTGLENFSSKVALRDTKTGETKKLSASDNVYTFMNNEGDQKNRFFLLTGDYTGVNMPSPSMISVHANRNRVNVYASSLDPIRSIKIYNAVGQLVESADRLSETFYQSPFIGEKGVYVVDVRTGNNARITKKVIVY